MQGWEFQGLAPSAVLAVAGIGCSVVLLLLLLRRRPPVVSVSSHVLWDRVLARTPNPLWRELAMVLLQLMVVLLAALALGDPRPISVSEVDGSVTDQLWIIDCSISMEAGLPGESSRLQQVRDELQGRLADLDARVRVGLVGAGAAAELLTPLGLDRRRLELALSRLAVDGALADLEGALHLASLEVAEGGPKVSVELFTDHPEAQTILQEQEGELGLDIHLQSPFQPLPNLAVASFEVRASQGLPPEEEAVVRLVNHSAWPAEALLRIETVDAILGESRVRIPAGGESLRRYRFSPPGPVAVEAVLRDMSFQTDSLETDVKDGLAADDRAWAWLEPTRPLTVGLVTPGNRYLQRALELVPGIQLQSMTPGDWERGGSARVAGADVVFLDRFVPSGPQPPRAVYLAPPGAEGPFRGLGVVDSPAVTDWNRDHPLFSGLVLRDLQVRQSMVLETREGDVRLLGSPSGALVVAREDETGLRQVAWGFELAASDLPLRLAFPQTVINTLLWMRASRESSPAVGRSTRLAGVLLANAGDSGSLFVDPGGEVVLVDRLEEAALQAEGRSGEKARQPWPVGTDPRLLRLPGPGLWSLVTPAGNEDLAVSVLDSSESRLWDLPEDAGYLPPTPNPAVPSELPELAWMWLAGLAACLLVVEFGVYSR